MISSSNFESCMRNKAKCVLLDYSQSYKFKCMLYFESFKDIRIFLNPSCIQKEEGWMRKSTKLKCCSKYHNSKFHTLFHSTFFFLVTKWISKNSNIFGGVQIGMCIWICKIATSLMRLFFLFFMQLSNFYELIINV